MTQRQFMSNEHAQAEARALRSDGLSYAEIATLLRLPDPMAVRRLWHPSRSEKWKLQHGLKANLTRICMASLLLLAGAAAASDLPTPSLTPGQVLTTDATTVCAKGYAKIQRHTPQSVKNERYRAYGIAHRKPGEYEIDHLISLELGGADVAANLWPQSYVTKPWNAHLKDRLENWLHAEVCAGRLPLAAAQAEIARDWIASYRQRIGAP